MVTEFQIREEKLLYEQIKEGNQHAFEIFFRKYYPVLKKYSSKITMNDEVANDIVQDTFLTLWESRMTIDSSKNLKSWLFSSVHNKSLNVLRRQKSEKKYLEYSNFLNQSQDVLLCLFFEDEVEEFKNDAVNRLFDTISQLTPQCRKVFELSRFQGMKNAAIASELNISIRTVETHISNAIKVIHKKMKDNPDVVFSILMMLNM